MRTRAKSPGFTLVELLVVVAIIALLIGILLPSLGGARESGYQARCMSNLRQVGLAATLYAQDYQDQIWHADEWSRLWNEDDEVWEPGLLYLYASDAEEIAECPSNKRRGVNNETVGGNDPGIIFSTELDFDYTMVARMEGARLGREVRLGHLRDPGLYSLNATPALVLPPILAEEVKPFNGTPLFLEESTLWYNEKYNDGMWGNMDQLTNRHDHGGMMVYLEGHAGLYKPPTDRNEVDRTKYDMETNDWYVWTRKSKWIRLEASAGWNNYGWINNPWIN